MEHPNGLQTSMWASRPETRARSAPRPKPSATSKQNYGSPNPEEALQRVTQCYKRLRWKHVDLFNSYQRALNPDEAGFNAADAEINFKIDFHEFYLWIEKFLVFVFQVFGFTIPSSSGNEHTFHHDLLRALEDEDNPLRGLLGTGDTYQALWKAKELRNRWKDAAEGKQTPPLKMYDLVWVVSEILGGLQAAYELAERRIEDISVGERQQSQNGWAWMVEQDAMDWEP